ncbi:MAG: hypothetical protein ACTSV7_13725 [Candidatus Baldrarchaeia archaeon]
MPEKKIFLGFTKLTLNHLHRIASQGLEKEQSLEFYLTKKKLDELLNAEIWTKARSPDRRLKRTKMLTLWNKKELTNLYKVVRYALNNGHYDCGWCRETIKRLEKHLQ